MSNQLQDGDRDTQVLSHAPINLAFPSHIVVEYNELDQKREKNRIAKRRNRQGNHTFVHFQAIPTHDCSQKRKAE